MTLRVKQPLSLYVHIPFCTTKCTYCAFNTYTHLEALIPAFVDALCAEIHYVAGVHDRNQPVWSVFFGGGTPSLLTPTQFEQIMTTLRSAFDIQPDAEWSLEANPSDLDRPYLAALRGLGMNRLSIGMQSAHASELLLFNRRHDNDAVARALFAARAAGFDNVNLDVIYGIPHQTMTMWEITLRQVIALQPEHVSLYALGLEDGTAMKDWVAKGKLPLPDDDLAADMYDAATEELGAAGYDQYEISNWARAGRECRHNLQYWRNWEYLGFGPGAHGWANGVRYSVMLSPQRYIKALAQAREALAYPRTPATDSAVLTERDDEIAETLIMGLRLTRDGIARDEFAARFGVDLLALHGAALNKFAAQGLVHITDERVRLTAQGRMLSNLVFRELV